MRRALSTALLVLAAHVAQGQMCSLQGRVVDSSGAVVSGAKVEAANDTAVTDAAGTFALTAECDSTLTVEAAGFAVERVAANDSKPIQVTLHVSRAEERMTVQAENELPEMTVVEREQLEAAPQPTLDGKLKEVPGFSLYRRTPSWSANPTTQGISLHGVGASGASRGLALLDGVPLNDPFGGWIYWGRISPTSLQSAEVSQTGASELYGSDAIGGVINLQRVQPTTTRATVETSLGDLFTPVGSGIASLARGDWSSTFIAEGFRTNGYVPIPAEWRGSVDTVANSEHGNGSVLVERNLGGGRVFAGADLYGESRQNGTVLQSNSATIREMRMGADWSSRAGDWSLRGFGGTEDLRQTFTAINDTRTHETMTRDQTVPAAQAGASLLWSKATGRNLLVAGADERWVDGESYEWAFSAGTPSSIARSGGGQRREGFFGEDRIRLGSRTLVTLGARFDHWSNRSGFASARPLSGAAGTFTRYYDRGESAFSPKIGASVAATHWMALHGSVSTGFRAPTLNELYRGFRVGNVVTLANAGLKAEHSTNLEGGASIAAGPAGRLQVTYFWTEIRDAVANVTQSATPSLITRMRENLGKLSSQGVDIRWERRLAHRWSVMGAYEFADPRVVDFAADPSLVGNWIPQVARQNATVAMSYAGPRWTVHADIRGQGKQFDDDRNALPLGGYVVVDAFVSRSLGGGVELFAAGENLTDRRYEVGKTPVVTLGPPVLARVGIRWRIGRR